MKRWIFLALAVVLVGGVGTILLKTQQAPLVIDDEPEVAPLTSDAANLPAVVSDLASAPPMPKRLSTEEFRALGAEVMKALPGKTEWKKEPGTENQGAPPAVVTAGVQLGRIAQAAADDPGLEAEAVTLFRECAASPQHPDSVRALCFANYRRLAQKTGVKADEKIVGRALRQLSEKLDQ